MKLSLPNLLPRGSKEREELVTSSLTSSNDISAWLASWSGSGDRTQPCSMKFHKEWLHPDCKVMKWYQKQTQSSTQFTSVEHWSSTEGPFFHEYLLVKLTDGGICRLERMGEGSRTNAISWGCNAHDIIQWFSAGSYDNNSFYQKPPRLILEVTFPQPFGLLDILAICYSIQQNQRSGSYTLQRYNCYFLCCTVLAILTRRVREQESIIAESLWKDIVESTLEELPDRKQDDALWFTSFGILSLLDSAGSKPADFVLESLRSNLDSTALSSLNNELSRALWKSELRLTVENGLLQSLSNVTRASLEGSNANSTELRSLLPILGQNPDPEPDLNLPLIQKAAAKAFLYAYTEGVNYLVESKQNKHAMRQLEAKRPFHKRLATSVFRTTVVYPRIALKMVTHHMHDGELILRELHNRFHVNLVQILSAPPISTALAMGMVLLPEDGSDFETDEDLAKTIEIILKCAVEQAFPILKGFLVQETPDVPGALTFLRQYFLEDCWAISVWTCVLNAIGDRIHALPTAKAIAVRENQGDSQIDWTIANFQEHLLKRIQDHAKRVELFKLAAAQLVEEDIKKTMTDVWRSLPPSFGNTAVGQYPADETPHKLSQLPAVRLVMTFTKKLHSVMHDA